MRLFHKPEPPPPPPPLTATMCIEGFEVSLTQANNATAIQIAASKDDTARIQQAIIYKLKQQHGIVRTNYSDGHLAISTIPFAEIKTTCETLAASITTPQALTDFLTESHRAERVQQTREDDTHAARIYAQHEKASQGAFVAFLAFCRKHDITLDPQHTEYMQEVLSESHAGSHHLGGNQVQEALDIYPPVIQAFLSA
jgi:hypothetical protein